MLRQCCSSCRGLLSSRVPRARRTLQPSWTVTLSSASSRAFSSKGSPSTQKDDLETFKSLLFPPKISPRDSWLPGKSSVVVHGFIGKLRKTSKALAFATIELENGELSGQICAKGEDQVEALRKIQPYSAVAVTGTTTAESTARRFDMELESIQYLNPFPKDIIVSSDAVFPPSGRYLQLRFHAKLRESLRFRAFLKSSLSQKMNTLGYLDVETPTLFKSTSEGAREFLVPTRRAGYAYALPQSPQQYKQVLMASGLAGYYQFARCYRDEDHRADRQPEFTQMDLEKSFATGETVQADVEAVVKSAWDDMRKAYHIQEDDSSFVPVKKGVDASEQVVSRKADKDTSQEYPEIAIPFQRMTYSDCMDKYGIDKPDLRIAGEIARVDGKVSPDFVGMISHLEAPIVEAWKFRLHEDIDRREALDFVKSFLGNLHPSFSKNTDGAPQALVYDTSKPLNGFSALGPEGLDAMQAAASPESGLQSLENGDIVVFQARQDRPHQGGSTKLGELRSLMYHAAIEANLLEKDNSFHFLWVTNFPMFTPQEEVDVGQGGSSGFSATHHPFTAPLTAEDVELLFTDPLKAKADHYDLVLNGVELGGGSRRIHVAQMQEFIFRNILKMSKEKIDEFSHLLKALRAGCPPHAGFALGFDRFAAVLSGSSSVRDVIAFPKNNKGVDEFAGGPGKLTNEALETYNLEIRRKKKV